MKEPTIFRLKLIRDDGIIIALSSSGKKARPFQIREDKNVGKHFFCYWYIFYVRMDQF